MFRLLVVDDEARVVTGIYEFLQESAGHLELEIARAYTVQEALEHAHQSKIDILMTDIKMPGMDGLELSGRVTERWPGCKTIFLSAYNDFDYAQDAIRLGGFDYILKIEGDDRVLHAIEKAIRAIEYEWANEERMRSTIGKMSLAFPSLRKELFLDLFEHRGLTSALRRRKFDELAIRLDPEGAALHVLGKVDLWPPEATASDRALLLYSIQNIAEEVLSARLRFASFEYDRSRFVWLLQPPIGTEIGNAAAWEDAIRFAGGMLDTIHSTYTSLLKLSVSLALNTEPASWEEAGERFQTFLLHLSYGTPRGTDSIVANAIGNAAQGGSAIRAARGEMDVRLKLKQLDALESLIDAGQAEEAKRFLADVLDSEQWKGEPGGRTYFSMEVFASLSAFWLTYVNRRGVTDPEKYGIAVSKLTRLDLFPSWLDVTDYFLRIAERLAKLAKERKAQQADELIQSIHGFVHHRLHEELSLTRLGEYVHLNPSYLSRLYKQLTGKGLLEYITERRIEKAKRLLRYSALKIHEIVSEVGLESGPYFTRLFKKATGLTPQEYRDGRAAGK